MRGVRYARLADDVASFAAATLFDTSDFALPASKKREQIALFALNTELCKITEDLVSSISWSSGVCRPSGVGVCGHPGVCRPSGVGVCGHPGVCRPSGVGVCDLAAHKI
jgi:hypothetical protein